MVPEDQKHWLQTYRENITTYGPAALVGLGVTYGAFELSETFLEVSLLSASYYGFLTGVCTSAIVAAGGAFVRNRWVSIRPEPVFQHALKVIGRSDAVLAQLGAVKVDPITEIIKAYQIDHGGFHLKKGFGGVGWSPATVKMLFLLEGSRGRGVVTLEAERKSGRNEMRLLAVDVLENSDAQFDNEPIMLIGGVADLGTRVGQLRNFATALIKK